MVVLSGPCNVALSAWVLTRILACFRCRRFCLALSPLIFDMSISFVLRNHRNRKGRLALPYTVRFCYAATTAAAVTLCVVELMTFETRTFGWPSRNFSNDFKSSGYAVVA